MIFITFSLILTDENIDFNEIENRLNLKPYIISKKGEKICKNIIAEQDVWCYSITRKVNSVKKISDEVYAEWRNIGLDLLLNKENIKYFIKKGLKLNLTINSNCEKVGFVIPNNIISDIVSYKIPFEIEYFAIF